MNGGAQRMAEGSLVSGTQCSTLLPKKVRPKASPLRIFRKSSMAFIEASYRLPSPSGVVMLLGDIDAELDVREHPLGLGRTELLRAGQQHDHHGQDQGRQRLGQLQRDRPAPARAGRRGQTAAPRVRPSASRPRPAARRERPARPARRDRQSSRDDAPAAVSGNGPARLGAGLISGFSAGNS